MIRKILIANRGEIALRIIRACREMEILTVAVHSTADEDAMHVRLADESVCIGPPSLRESYMNIPALIAACEITGADAIHPGYGFLSENAGFAEIVAEHDIIFIGPDASHISQMGDKITARRTALELGLPLTPGVNEEIGDEASAARIAEEIGYPVLLKATAGGGGRGMRVVLDRSELSASFRAAQGEALTVFNNGALYMERYLSHPRHIEIQVLGDGRGGGIHLGERDCSIQRRHQKVFEEAPSPALTFEERDRIGCLAADAIAKLGYRGAGTLEFLYEDGEFYFIEMNTRLQVEHPITESVTGVDLVREQIRIASDLGLSFSQDEVHFSGHAFECRINAEDALSFTPCPGLITALHAPGGMGVRLDSAIYSGYRVPPYYDSLISKLIVSGNTRADCVVRVRGALHEYVIDGIETTLPLFREIFSHSDIIDGVYDIHWLENYLADRQ